MNLPISRKKVCKHCAKDFAPHNQLQVVCGPRCAIGMVSASKKLDREKTRARKVAIKKISELVADAQRSFNLFIRKRDQLAGYPCISSGKALDWSGNAVDAGHWRSTGAAAHLRFNEDNCHAQSKHDNRYLAGNAAEYRIGLIARIGLERVAALEANNEPHKWAREELIDTKETYKKKLKELENGL